jgi:hypothetical protein
VVPPFKRSRSGTPAAAERKEEDVKDEMTLERDLISTSGSNQHSRPEVLYHSPPPTNLIDSLLEGRLEKPFKSSNQPAFDVPTTNVDQERHVTEKTIPGEDASSQTMRELSFDDGDEDDDGEADDNREYLGAEEGSSLAISYHHTLARQINSNYSPAFPVNLVIRSSISILDHRFECKGLAITGHDYLQPQYWQ